MSNVKRVYVEKKPGFAVQAKDLKHEIKSYLGVKDIENVRVLIRYDVENISDDTFEKACNILTQIIAQVGSNIYGKQYIDLSCLGRFFRKGKEIYEKELKFKEKLERNEIDEIVNKYAENQLKDGVQTIKYQLKTLNTTGGKEPNVILYLDLNQEKEYLE